MSRIKNIIDPKLAQFILEKCKIMKKRPPYWYFSKEVRRTSKDKLSNVKIANMWHNLDPESKRLYFTMAELDEVRYKDQRSSWVAEIGSILKHGNELGDMLSEPISNLENGKDLLKSLDKYQRDYGKMIQADSTNKLYRDVIDKNDTIDLNMTTEKLISAVPENFRPVLSKPRRPPSPFALYTWIKRDELMKIRAETDPTTPFLKFVSQMWTNLQPNVKDIYNKKYDTLMIEYEIAKNNFKENSNQDPTYLEEASRERKAFKKSIKKKLRDYGVLPVNIRNAFNFFVMENKGVPLTDLTKVWRSMSEEQKLRYKKMSQEDSVRYYNDLSPDLIKNLTKLLNNKRCRQTSVEDK